MAAPRWNLQQILLVIVIFLSSLASSIHHVDGMSSQARMSRRILGQMPERQAPRGFPPPASNAFFQDPRKLAPPGRPYVGAPGEDDGRPPARLPENARRLVPPPHP